MTSKTGFVEPDADENTLRKCVPDLDNAGAFESAVGKDSRLELDDTLQERGFAPS